MASQDVEAQQPLLEQQQESKASRPQQSSDRPGILFTVGTMLLSIPALAGSCCWPLLLAGFAGISATAAAKALSHTLSFGIILAALTNLAQYTAWKSADRRGSHWRKYGPLYLILLAIPFIMADLTRHVLQDADIWVNGSSMFVPDCPYSERGLGGFRCLSAIGWLFTIFFTYTGFALLIAGTFWGADLHKKIPAGWREIRNASGRVPDQCERCQQ